MVGLAPLIFWQKHVEMKNIKILNLLTALWIRLG